MSEFELLFSVFSLLIGLIVAELSMRLADAIDAHPNQHIGILTPMLAGFVLLDAVGFWLWAWSARDAVSLSWPVIFGTFSLLLIYFLSAALVFPRTGPAYEDLDLHYWQRKRLVVGGILTVNLLLLGAQLTRALPRWSDLWFFVGQATYILPMLLLIFSRRRWQDLALLGLMISSNILYGTGVLPGSQWGREVGVSATPASTSGQAQPR